MIVLVAFPLALVAIVCALLAAESDRPRGRGARAIGLVTGGSAPTAARRRTSRLLPVAVLVIAALGAWPLFLFQVVGDPDPPPRATGDPLTTLVETAAWSFGGPVPERMTPIAEYQVERGLGAPPREVTVPLGTTGVAAAMVAQLTLLALVARRLGRPGDRCAVLTIGPLALLAASLVV